MVPPLSTARVKQMPSVGYHHRKRTRVQTTRRNIRDACPFSSKLDLRTTASTIENCNVFEKSKYILLTLTSFHFSAPTRGFTKSLKQRRRFKLPGTITVFQGRGVAQIRTQNTSPVVYWTSVKRSTPTNSRTKSCDCNASKILNHLHLQSGRCAEIQSLRNSHGRFAMDDHKSVQHQSAVPKAPRTRIVVPH